MQAGCRMAWLAFSIFVFFPLFAQDALENAKQKRRDQERVLFAAKDATEAIMTFNGRVEMRSSRKPSNEQALKQIEEQLWHLFGPMGEGEFPGVPRSNHTIPKPKITKSGEKEGTYLIEYHYRGTVLITRGPRNIYDIYLPANPDEIYKASLVTESGKKKNVCTDEKYNGEEDFGYFWAPWKTDECNKILKEGKHYYKIAADIKRIRNTDRTYPEYNRMVHPDPKDGVPTIHVSVLVGMDNPANGKDPWRSSDLNAKSYKTIVTTLRDKMGYEEVGFPADYKRSILGGRRLRGHFERWVKEKTKRGVRIVTDFFFGPSGIDQASGAFHYFLRVALFKIPLTIYDGHSGLGGHLDLEWIERIRKQADPGFQFEFDPSLYQVYFFNSCSSYTWYNTIFFHRKSKSGEDHDSSNLEVLNNGLPSAFESETGLPNTNLELIRAVDAWAEMERTYTYQELADKIDRHNLFGVNGDEDESNKSKPGDI